MIALAFADTGIGMTPEVAERAFEPFFTTKEGGRGTGLGLFAVYSFATAVGGHAAIESAPDKGTTVTLRLPAVPRSAAAAAAPAALGAVPAGRGETILVVEDNAEVRRLVEGMLESLGYRTVLAADAASGLAALDRPGPLPDLLLSDVILTGGVTGFQLADKARARHPGLRTVFMSGYTADAERAGVTGRCYASRSARTTSPASCAARSTRRRRNRVTWNKKTRTPPAWRRGGVHLAYSPSPARAGSNAGAAVPVSRG